VSTSLAHSLCHSVFGEDWSSSPKQPKDLGDPFAPDTILATKTSALKLTDLDQDIASSVCQVLV
jgi:hypothetical protein